MMSFLKGSTNSYYSKRFYSDVCDDTNANSTPLSNFNTFSPQLSDNRLPKRLCTASSVLSTNSPLNRTSSHYLQGNASMSLPRRRDSSLLTFTASPSDMATGINSLSRRPSFRDPSYSTVRRSSSLHTSFPFCVPGSSKSSTRDSLTGTASLLQSLQTSHNVMRDRDEKESVIRALKILESKKRRFDECGMLNNDSERISRDEMLSEIDDDNNSKRQRLLSYSSLVDDRSSISSVTGSTSQEVLTKLRDNETFQLTSICDIVSPNAKNNIKKSFSGLGGRRQSLRRTILNPEGSNSSFSAKNGPGTISDQASSVSSHEFSPKTVTRGPPSIASSILGPPSEQSRASGQSNLSMRRRLSYMTPAQIEAQTAKRSAAVQLMHRDSIDKVTHRGAANSYRIVLSPSKRNNITQTDTESGQLAEIDTHKPILRNKALSVSEFISNLDKNRRQPRLEEISSRTPSYDDFKKQSNTVLENRLSRIRRLLVNFTDEANQPSNSSGVGGTFAPIVPSSTLVTAVNSYKTQPVSSQITSSAPVLPSSSTTIATSSVFATTSTPFVAFSLPAVTAKSTVTAPVFPSINSSVSVMPASTKFEAAAIIPSCTNVSAPVSVQASVSSSVNKSVADLVSANKSLNVPYTSSSNAPASSFAFGSVAVTNNSTPSFAVSSATSLPFSFGTSAPLSNTKPSVQPEPVSVQVSAKPITSTGGFSFGKDTVLPPEPHKAPSSSFLFGKTPAVSLDVTKPKSTFSEHSQPQSNAGLSFAFKTSQEVVPASMAKPKAPSSAFAFGKTPVETSNSLPTNFNFGKTQQNSQIESAPTFAIGETQLLSNSKPLPKASSFPSASQFNVSDSVKTVNLQKAPSSTFAFGKPKEDSQKSSSAKFVFGKPIETSQAASPSALNFSKSNDQSQNVQSTNVLQKPSNLSFNLLKPQECSQLSSSFNMQKPKEIVGSTPASLFPSSNSATNMPTNGTLASQFTFGQSNPTTDTAKQTVPSSLFGQSASTTIASPFGTFKSGSNISNQSPFLGKPDSGSVVLFGSSSTTPQAISPFGIMQPAAPCAIVTSSSSLFGTNKSVSSFSMPLVPGTNATSSVFGTQPAVSPFTFNSSGKPAASNKSAQPTLFPNASPATQTSAVFGSASASPFSSSFSAPVASIAKPFATAIEPSSVFPPVTNASTPVQSSGFSINSSTIAPITPFKFGTVSDNSSSLSGPAKTGGFNFGAQNLNNSTIAPTASNIFNQAQPTIASQSARKKTYRNKK